MKGWGSDGEIRRMSVGDSSRHSQTRPISPAIEFHLEQKQSNPSTSLTIRISVLSRSAESVNLNSCKPV